MDKPSRPGRSGLAFLRDSHLALVAAAAPLAVLLVVVLAVAVPTIGAPARTAPDGAEQGTGSPNPNYRRVAVTSPRMTFEISLRNTFESTVTHPV